MNDDLTRPCDACGKACSLERVRRSANDAETLLEKILICSVLMSTLSSNEAFVHEFVEVAVV
jgi:Fe-S-cluster containining protein